MCTENVPNRISVRQLTPKYDFIDPYSQRFKKKVTCVMDAATTTCSIIHEFISDKLQDKSIPSTDEISGSMLSKSTSINYETIHYAKSMENKSGNLTPNSLNESVKLDHQFSSATSSDDFIFSEKSTPNKNIKLSNGTPCDTFGFLFALKKSQRETNMDNAKLEKETLPEEEIHFFSNDRYSTVLLSTKYKPKRNVNFDVLKTTVVEDSISKEKGNKVNLTTNRQVYSFVYPTRLPVRDNLLSRNMLEIQYGKVTVLPDQRNECKLPSNAEGDTTENYSNLIQVYPNFINNNLLKQTLLNYIHPDDSNRSFSCKSTEISRYKHSLSTDKVKPEKIFSQIHHPLPTGESSRPIGNLKEIKNHSIETMIFFHNSLAPKQH